MMEVYNLKIQKNLLFGSEIDNIVADGLYDEDLEQDDLQKETPKSIWDEAW
ncbi:MAG: hypothetical protein II806_02090 [Bacteroidaceae bacterium]|nr:hypothetical protein [Bacteroidaceae bacterium]